MDLAFILFILAYFFVVFPIAAFTDSFFPISRFSMFANLKFPVCAYWIYDENGSLIKVWDQRMQALRMFIKARERNFSAEDCKFVEARSGIHPPFTLRKVCLKGASLDTQIEVVLEFKCE